MDHTIKGLSRRARLDRIAAELAAIHESRPYRARSRALAHHLEMMEARALGAIESRRTFRAVDPE